MNVDDFTVVRGGLESSIYFQVHKFSYIRSGKKVLWETNQMHNRVSCFTLEKRLKHSKGSFNSIESKRQMFHHTLSLLLS